MNTRKLNTYKNNGENISMYYVRHMTHNFIEIIYKYTHTQIYMTQIERTQMCQEVTNKSL